MDNAMDVDDPNAHYVSPFLSSNLTLVQTDGNTLAYVLHLAKAVPDRTRSVPHDIKEERPVCLKL
jgi:hypothetical protein